MPSVRQLLPLLTAAAATTTAATIAGCSTGGDAPATRDAPASAASAASAAEQSAAASPGERIELSPAGVTTRINVPAQSMEEQYAQACMHAKDWMTTTGGDPKALVEPLLKEVQSSTQGGPVTFGTTWPQLSEAQQAAVIIAVQAAADGGC